jgi:hypothetical protein
MDLASEVRQAKRGDKEALIRLIMDRKMSITDSHIHIPATRKILWMHFRI